MKWMWLSLGAACLSLGAAVTFYFWGVAWWLMIYNAAFGIGYLVWAHFEYRRYRKELTRQVLSRMKGGKYEENLLRVNGFLVR